MACRKGCCASQLEHYKSVGISASALPNKSGPIVSVDNKEKGWAKDFEALKECKRMGVTPKQTDGLADLMSRAATKFEIEHGQAMTQKQREQYNAIAEVNEGKLALAN